MTTRPLEGSCLIALRLPHAEKEKLDALCHHTQRRRSDLVRALIRMAEPIDLPSVPVTLTKGRAPEEAYAGDCPR
jgi:hypothetical protein